tara:strand:+ start:11542 stop:12081 length:540 start_codon:yes stop_codon:yes gene_type:complete
MKTQQKFLEFNGKNIVFLDVEGTYWIALKPILDALEMDADRSIKRMKKDPILGPARSIQTVQVPENSENQGRNMTCLPEKYIYGWIFSLRSDSSALTEYKKTCYDLLFDHFHGTITSRKELLMQRQEIDDQIHHLKKSLKEEDAKFKQLQLLQSKRKTLSTQLNTIDKELVKQPELFKG